MKSTECVLLWNRGEEARIVPFPEGAQPFLFSTLAPYASLHRMGSKDRTIAVLREAIRLMVDHGIAPRQLDAELRAVDEYREVMDADIFGAGITP